MKKIKSILFLLLIIIICYYGFKLLIVEHNFTYKINKYNVDEHFYKKNGHHYELIITNKKENYTYTIDKNLSKQKRIIKDIKVYKKNNLKCIIPIYKKDVDKNIYCNLDNIQVSNDYLLKTNNEDFNKIIKKVKIKLPSSNNKKKKYKKIFVYNKNINNNNFYIWNYKGIYILNNTNKYVKILDYDLYDNLMSCVVDKYYVLFENTSVNGIENIYYYDSIKNKINLFKLKEKLDKDSYINGVVNNLIYVTDRRNKKEYTIDIRKKKITEIDDEQSSYIVFNNSKKKKLSKSDYFMKDQIFDYSNSNYKYFIEDNKIYKQLKSKKNKTLLLELNDIVEWKVVDDEIIILVDNTIYYYSDDTGLRKILENNELRYNYKNIYNIGKN